MGAIMLCLAIPSGLAGAVWLRRRRRAADAGDASTDPIAVGARDVGVVGVLALLAIAIDVIPSGIVYVGWLCIVGGLGAVAATRLRRRGALTGLRGGIVAVLLAMLLGATVHALLSAAFVSTFRRDAMWLTQSVCAACERGHGRDYDGVRASRLQETVGQVAIETGLAMPLMMLKFVAVLSDAHIDYVCPEPLPDSDACMMACCSIPIHARCR